MKLLRSVHNKYSSFSFVVRLIIATFVFFLFFVLCQNPQIFPGAVMGLSESTTRDPSTLPNGVVSEFVLTEDKKRLEVWKLPAKDSKHVAVIFHGNAGDVANFFPYQKFFYEQGITTYSFDYRGYGKSSGWPTERGLSLDSEAVLNYVMKEDRVSPENIIIVGISIGTGPASYIAEKLNVGTLVMYSPMSTLKEVVKSKALIGILHPFLLYKFPVLERVKQMKHTCLIVAHGKNDTVIPYEQGERVFQEHNKIGNSFLISSEDSGHNQILYRTKDRMKSTLKNCLKN